MSHLQKWLQTIQISISKQMAYKINFILLVIGPSLVFFFIKYNIWTAIFANSPNASIEGYNLETMLQYQGWVLIVALLSQSHNSMNLSEDIRLGRITAYLIYPFSFWQFHTASYMGSLVVQFFVVVITIVCFYFFHLFPALNFPAIAQGFILTFVVSFLWYIISYIIGILAFWLEETWVFRVMFVTVSQFLSGSLLPIEVLPAWLGKAIMYTPFPYLTWAPAKTFMGNPPLPVTTCLAILMFWIVIAYGLAKFTWSRGVRMYSAAGM